jgi:hypothetical protein
MTKDKSHNDGPRSRVISRRDFCKIAAASLLAGCTPNPQPEATPTATPRPTVTPKPTPVTDIRRPDVIRMYPKVASKVVHARHASAWDGEQLVPGAIRMTRHGRRTRLTRGCRRVPIWVWAPTM